MTDLNKTQRQRADALVVAGRVLGKSGTFPALGHLPEHRAPEDVVDLANYILNGTHPLERYDDPERPAWEPILGTPVTLVSTPGDDHE